MVWWTPWFCMYVCIALSMYSDVHMHWAIYHYGCDFQKLEWWNYKSVYIKSNYMYSHWLDSTEIQLLHTTENHNKTEPTELRRTKLHYFFIFSKKKNQFHLRFTIWRTYYLRQKISKSQNSDWKIVWINSLFADRAFNRKKLFIQHFKFNVIVFLNK